MIAAALTGLFLFAGVLQQEPGDERKPLQGEWLLLSTTDIRRQEAGSPSIRMEITEDGRLIYRLNQLVTNQGTIKVSAGGKLKHIDLVLDDGQMFQGVYELKECRLTVCFSEAGKARPLCIKTVGTQWAENWKRP
jgi:uncharacterized protein (TIGR03067 family)